MLNFEFFLFEPKAKKYRVKDGVVVINKVKSKVVNIGTEYVGEYWNGNTLGWEQGRMFDFIEIEAVDTGSRTTLKDVLLEEPLKKEKNKDSWCKAYSIDGAVIVLANRECGYVRIFRDVNLGESGSWFCGIEKDFSTREDLFEFVLREKPDHLNEIEPSMLGTLRDLLNRHKTKQVIDVDSSFNKFVELAYDDVKFYLTNNTITLDINLYPSGTGTCEFDLRTPLAGELKITKGVIRAESLQRILKKNRKLELSFLESRGAVFSSIDEKTGIEFLDLIQEG